MKKNLKKILLIIVSIFAILFIIQTVDWMINGNEYRAIDEYIEKINQISKTKTFEICSQNTNDIYKEIVPKIYTDEKISVKFQNSDIYITTIDNCKIAADEMKKINVPVNISLSKQYHLKEYNKINIFFIESNIKNIESFEKCKGNKKCLNNIPEDLTFSYAFANESINMIEHLRYAKKRLSIISIFKDIYADFKIYALRKELEQMKGK